MFSAPVVPKSGQITGCCGSKVISVKVKNRKDIEARKLLENNPGVVVFTKPPVRSLKSTYRPNGTEKVRYERVKTRNGAVMFGLRVD